MNGWERLGLATRKIADAATSGPDQHEGTWTRDSPIALSLASSDDDHRRGITEAHHRAALAYASALDHLHALAHLVAAEDVLMGTWTVARGALEAIAVVHYLTDPEASPTERSRRYINDRLLDLEERRILLGNLTDQAAGDALEENRDEVAAMVDMAKRLGFRVTHPKRGAVHAGDRAPGSTSLVRRAIDDDGLAAVVYQGLSATAHGRAFGTSRFLISLEDPPEDGAETVRGQLGATLRETALQCVAAPLAVTTTAYRLYNAFGWTTEPLHIPFELVLSAWARAAGFEAPTFGETLDRHRARQPIPDSFRRR